jgi:hypothetical protein
VPGSFERRARTLDGSTGSWIQVDRGARASQGPFLAGEEKSAYDARFIAVFAHSLQHTGGYTQEEATRVAASHLPDVLPYEPTLQASYPSNGRSLIDDVELYFLPLLTNGKIAGDGVAHHTDLLAEFPYVGPPHTARTG